MILKCHIHKNHKGKHSYLANMSHQISELTLFGEAWFQLPKRKKVYKSLKDDQLQGNLLSKTK